MPDVNTRQQCDKQSRLQQFANEEQSNVLSSTRRPGSAIGGGLGDLGGNLPPIPPRSTDNTVIHRSPAQSERSEPLINLRPLRESQGFIETPLGVDRHASRTFPSNPNSSTIFIPLQTVLDRLSGDYAQFMLELPNMAHGRKVSWFNSLELELTGFQRRCLSEHQLGINAQVEKMLGELEKSRPRAPTPVPHTRQQVDGVDVLPQTGAGETAPTPETVPDNPQEEQGDLADELDRVAGQSHHAIELKKLATLVLEMLPTLKETHERIASYGKMEDLLSTLKAIHMTPEEIIKPMEKKLGELEKKLGDISTSVDELKSKPKECPNQASLNQVLPEVSSLSSNLKKISESQSQLDTSMKSVIRWVQALETKIANMGADQNKDTQKERNCNLNRAFNESGTYRSPV